MDPLALLIKLVSMVIDWFIFSLSPKWSRVRQPGLARCHSRSSGSRVSSVLRPWPEAQGPWTPSGLSYRSPAASAPRGGIVLSYGNHPVVQTEWKQSSSAAMQVTSHSVLSRSRRCSRCSASHLPPCCCWPTKWSSSACQELLAGARFPSLASRVSQGVPWGALGSTGGKPAALARSGGRTLCLPCWARRWKAPSAVGWARQSWCSPGQRRRLAHFGWSGMMWVRRIDWYQSTWEWRRQSP